LACLAGMIGRLASGTGKPADDTKNRIRGIAWSVCLRADGPTGWGPVDSAAQEHLWAQAAHIGCPFQPSEWYSKDLTEPLQGHLVVLVSRVNEGGGRRLGLGQAVTAGMRPSCSARPTAMSREIFPIGKSHMRHRGGGGPAGAGVRSLGLHPVWLCREVTDRLRH
jgi:hypothetical protein